MPFKKFRKGKKWCVYTVDEEGQAVGKPHGEFDTPAEADAQMRALYANMDEEDMPMRGKMSMRGNMMIDYKKRRK